MNISKLFSYLIIFIISLASCNSNFTPRPRGYFKIDLPEKKFKIFSEAGYPYTFEYPAYASISKEVDSTGYNPYWINLDFPDFNANIHLSYKDVNGVSQYKVKTAGTYRDSLVKNSFEGLREEAYKMTYKHTVKASGIIDSSFSTPNGSSGVYFYVSGQAATSRQFYITNTSKHFLRGALYFQSSPNADSLSMVSDFLAEDIKHLISTLKWR